MVKAHMDKKGVSVFFVHHNRKMADEGDPFNMISGTNGMGAADTIFVITKDKRADQEATLHITGRDVEQSDTVIQFNKDTWEWEVVGAADWLKEQRERLAYESSPIVKTIKQLLEQSPEHRWDGTCKELLEAGQYIAHTFLAATPQKLGYELRNLDKPCWSGMGLFTLQPKRGEPEVTSTIFITRTSGFWRSCQTMNPYPSLICRKTRHFCHNPACAMLWAYGYLAAYGDFGGFSDILEGLRQKGVIRNAEVLYGCRLHRLGRCGQVRGGHVL